LELLESGSERAQGLATARGWVPEQALDSEMGSAQAQDWVPGRDSEMAQEMG
jgi:hypothetical protein